jgi:hypothetical protein
LWLNQLTETRQEVSILVTWARMPNHHSFIDSPFLDSPFLDPVLHQELFKAKHVICLAVR